MPPGVFLVQSGVTWVTPADVVGVTYQGTAARVRANDTEFWVECGDTPGNWIPFNLALPNQLAGIPVKLTELIVYYYTATAGAYIDWVQIRRLNPADGTFTKPLDSTTDLGNGSTGNANASLLSGPITFDPGYPYQIVVKQAGASAFGHVRIYGFKATWEAT